MRKPFVFVLFLVFLMSAVVSLADVDLISYHDMLFHWFPSDAVDTYNRIASYTQEELNLTEREMYIYRIGLLDGFELHREYLVEIDETYDDGYDSGYDSGHSDGFWAGYEFALE